MANFTSIKRRYYEETQSPTNWTAPSGTLRLKAGYRENNHNFVGAIEFSMPTACSSITLVFYNTDNTRSNRPNMRFKFTDIEDENLVKQIENDAALGQNTVVGDSEVEVSYKIGSNGKVESSIGNFFVNTANWGQTTVTFNKTLTPGTHYLYIWSNNFSQTYNYMDICWRSSGSYKFSATYTETSYYTISYNANGYGTAPAAQTKFQNVSLNLQPFISNQVTTGYTVSFNTNGGSSATPSSITSTITKSQASWNTNSSGTGTNYGSSAAYTENASVTLYAKWNSTNNAITLPAAASKNSSSVQYTISYNANGGTSTPSSQTITRTTPYTFVSWSGYAAGASYTPSAATTLTAQWTTGTTTGTITTAAAISKNNTTQSGYTVTFNANGGTCSTSSLTATDTVKWTFSKWNTNSSGTGTNYSASTSYEFGANTTLYAKWTSSISSRGSITLPTPTRTGYTFKGWSTSSSASSGSTGTYTPSSNVTLYATWQINTWTVSYNANGRGTAPAAQTKVYNQTLTLQPFIGQQTASGYTVSFDANGGDSTPSSLVSTIYYNQSQWNTSSNGGGTSYGSKGSYTANNAATLYAIWSESKGSVTLPTITRKGYNFKGWSTSSTATSGITGSYTPTSNIKLYAVWQRTVAPIVYIGNGSSYSKYEVYIGDGSKWNLYEPYIGNGSNWIKHGQYQS